MVDIVQVGLSVDSKQVDKGTKSLDKLGKQGKKTETATNKMTKSFKLLGGVMAAISFIVLISGAINTAAAFEKMEASLVTVTGSMEKASTAMDGIKTFATETPFQVREITDAFIKLKALGIAPTEANLRSFGNTASAMGKSLNQMIEAVADAATGEFERLKEFGIKAKSEGDKVSFTFQGVTTTIGKNADEITKFLEGIGEVQFAGAMEKQMNTLDGAFSNFSDTVDNAVAKLSKESGFNELIKSATNGVSGFIRELTGTETIDDFNVKIDETNELIKVWNKRLEDAKATNEGAFFGGFFTSGAIQSANNQLNILNKRMADLQESAAAAKAASGGIEEAGALDPELVASKAIDAQFERDILLFDMQARRLEMDQFENDEKQRMLDERLAVETDYYDRLFNMQAGSQKAALDFTSAIRDNDLKDALQNGSLMLANAAKQNKAGFELQKAFALANAVVTLPSAVMKSFDNGGGYPFGLIPAGLMLAQGLAQIQSIRSSSFGGGGTPAAVSGGGTSPSAPVASGLPPGATAVPDAAEQPAVKELRLTLVGDAPGSDALRQLADNLAETIEDMGGVGRLVIS